MKLPRCLVVVLLVLPALASDSPRDDDSATVAAGVEGTWELLGYTFDGRPGNTGSDWGMIFRAGEWEWTGSSQNPKGNYTVDRRHSPAWVDRTTTNYAANYTLKGIYRIDGNILKMAWFPNSDARPQNFDPSPDHAVCVATFRRVR
jgi:uncharacterized protein (TIGR03067 family)